MIHRAAGILAVALALAGPVPRTFGQVRGQPPPPPAPPAAAAPVQVVPAEDPRRIELEERLKDLQRREIDTTELSAKEALLNEIILYCIELGRDYASYQQQLTEVKAKLAAEAQKDTLRRRLELRNRALKDRAVNSFTSTPPKLNDALRDLNEVLRVAPGDREAAALKARVTRSIRNQLYRRVALGGLVSVASIAALVPLVKRVRKGSKTRELEMIEGPQPGEVFRLEKDSTSLGALTSEADIVITDPFRKISRRHCEISRSGRYYFLADFSTNGTSINGKPVPKGEPVLLRRGDLIALTDDVVLKFR
jgi:FHA domain-containing protein